MTLVSATIRQGEHLSEIKMCLNAKLLNSLLNSDAQPEKASQGTQTLSNWHHLHKRNLWLWIRKELFEVVNIIYASFYWQFYKSTSIKKYFITYNFSVSIQQTGYYPTNSLDKKMKMIRVSLFS